MAKNKPPEGVPRATLVLGDKERTLVFTLGTAIRIKRQMGLELEEAFARFQQGAIEDMPVLIWAMIAHGDDADLSVEDVADMIGLDQMAAVNEAISEIMGESTDSEDSEPGKPKAKGKAKAKASA